MKKLCIVLLLFLPVAGFCQYGISAGYSPSWISNKQHPRQGLGVSLWFEKEISKKIYWKQGIGYSQKGSGKERETDTLFIDNDVRSFNFDYLELQQLFFYKVTNKLSVGVGHNLSFLVNSKKRSKNHIYIPEGIAHSYIYSDAKTDNGIDIPLVVSLKYDLKYLSLETRYTHGLINVVDKGALRTFYVGVNINLNKPKN